MTSSQTITSNEALCAALAEITGAVGISGTGGNCKAIEVHSTRRTDEYLLITDGDANLPLDDESGSVDYGIFAGRYETATGDAVISEADEDALLWVNLEADDPEHPDSIDPIGALLVAVRTWHEA